MWLLDDCQDMETKELGEWGQMISALEQFVFKASPSGPMLSISRNVRLSVHLSVHVFTSEVPFKRLFAPTSRSRMSNIF